MEKEIFKVKPIVLYPKCRLKFGKQLDCRVCNDKDVCKTYQPRSMCINPYKNHPKGCPNFGKLPTCPPNIPCMYDEIFDISDVYAVVTKYNLYEHYAKMRANNPYLAEGQIRNKMYYQHTDKKNNDIAVSEFYRENDNIKDYVSTRLLECMGVQVVDTMKEVGLEIKFPVEEYVYRVAFLAKVYEEALIKYGFEIYEETNGIKKGMKTLVRKK